MQKYQKDLDKTRYLGQSYWYEIFIRYKESSKMATKDIIHLQALRSKDILSGSSVVSDVAKYFDGECSPKLPNPEDLEFGDIALNIAKGYETIAIKNFNGEIVYIPFNLTQKTLAQEESLAILRNDFEAAIETLNSDIDELQNTDIEISSAIFNLRNESYNKINGLSGWVITNNEILAQQIADNVSLINQNKNDINELTDMVIAEFVKYDSKLSDKIQELKNSLQEIKSQISGTSIASDEKINILSGYVDNQIESLSDGLDNINKTLSSKVSGLSANMIVMSAKTDTMNEQLHNMSGNVYSRMSLLSGNIESIEEKLQKEIIDRINGDSDISAVTKGNSSSIVELSGSTKESLNQLTIKIDTETNNLANKIDAVSSDTAIGLAALDNKFSDETENLNGKISKVETIVEKNSSSIVELSGSTKESLNQLNGNIDLIEDDLILTKDTIDEVSGLTVANKNAVLNIINDLNTALRNLISESQEAAEEYCDNAIEEEVECINANIEETNFVTAAAFAKWNDSLGFTIHGDYDPQTELLNGLNVTEAIDAVYSTTKSEITKQNESLEEVKQNIVEQNIFICNVSAKTETIDVELQEKITSIGQKIDDTNDFLNQVNDESINRDSQLENSLNDSVEALNNDIEFGLTNLNESLLQIINTNKQSLENNITTARTYAVEVSTQYTKTTANGINETINQVNNTTKKELLDKINSDNKAINETINQHVLIFDEFRTETREAEKIASQTIAKVQHDIQDINNDIIDLDEEYAELLEETNFVLASAFAAWNESLGFTEYGEYIPNIPIFSGHTVTEAIDMLYQQSTGSTETLVKSIQNLKTSTDERLTEFGEQITNVEEEVAAMDKKIVDFKNRQMSTVTYEKLLRLIDNKELALGQLYRITNYQTTVNPQLSNISTRLPIKTEASCGFDILVRAISHNSLDENAWLMQNGEYYFQQCNINAWQIKYSVRNNTERFAWAKEDGFGVIYYMKDEFGNEAPYDFKNIKFNGNFTFTNSENNSDASLNGVANTNIIKEYFNVDHIQELNKIIFIAKDIVGNVFSGGCNDIRFNGDSYISNLISSNINGVEFTESFKGRMLGYK